MSSFHFKKFSVAQDQCAMKIGTDATLLGAWAKVEAKKRILDIGTGTGILSLMLAQRNPIAEFDAIEIEEKAYKQATYNLQNSPWASQIKIFHSSLQAYVLQQPTKLASYDFIISNPPFFVAEKNIIAPEQARAFARSTESLPFRDLLAGAYKLLTITGILELILPSHSFDSFQAEALEQGFHLQEICWVASKEGKKPNRVLLSYAKEACLHPNTTYLNIKDSSDAYSKEYIDLEKDYYLIF